MFDYTKHELELTIENARAVVEFVAEDGYTATPQVISDFAA